RSPGPRGDPAMTPIPSRRMLVWLGGGVGASLLLLAFPGAGLVVLAWFLVLAGAALLDLALTPGPGVLEVLRFAPERYSMMTTHVIRLRVRNRGRARLQLRLRDSLPETFRSEVAELQGTVAGGGEASWEYEVRPQARGRFAWGPVH